MAGLFVFAITLLAGVLTSRLAQRTIVSTAVLFLVAGFVTGQGGLAILHIEPGNPIVYWIAEIALFAILFTDGMRAGIRDVAAAWRLPGRALLVGMPLTLLATAAFARAAVGLPWSECFLLGAALSATDPVLAAAVIGHDDVPRRLGDLLNVESGLNDGLALPVVVILITVLSRAELHPGRLAAEVALGIAIGIAVPWAVIRLAQLPIVGVSQAYEPLTAFTIGLLIFATGSLCGANLFLAGFAGGVTVATMSAPVRGAFQAFGETVGELLKLAALLVFGAMISPAFLLEISAGGYTFAALALLAARPLALAIALFRSGLDWREWAAAAWFGPKGFASVVYALLIVRADVPHGTELFHLIAVVTAASVIAHSSTDVVVARWFRQQQAAGTDHERQAA